MRNKCSTHGLAVRQLAVRHAFEAVRQPVAEIERPCTLRLERVAAERDRIRRESEARQAQEAEERRLAAERATPEYQARDRERRQRISALLSDMRRRIGMPPAR